VVSPHTFGAVNAPEWASVAARNDSKPRDIGRYDRTRRTAKARGQSVTEFALILPVMLAFLGLTLDFARVFQAWITLESATRDAAEAAATNATTTAGALDVAQRTICLQSDNIPGFTRSALTSPDDVQLCAAPTVTIVTFTRSTTAVGASTTYPLGTATVQARMTFAPLLAWPLITQNGTWTITTQESFSIFQGRK
jgi:Flp pilus assembly protein TadG